jgi:predicted ATPase/class 3 adenylate cyclase
MCAKREFDPAAYVEQTSAVVALSLTRENRRVQAELPTGTVTFLFTDIEGSTRLLRELGDGYAEVLREHRRALRGAWRRHGGVEVDTQGDAFFVAFARASDAVAAAEDAQLALADGPVRVRMGLHTGEPLLDDEGYVGFDVHRAARIAAAGHGGQVLLSQATADLAGGDVRDLGLHRLKDLSAPERLYQLGTDDFPPLSSLDTVRHNLPVLRSSFVGRESELIELCERVVGRRFVTLTGIGGSGKTRLALEAAARLVERFPQGVFFVDLAVVSDPELVGQALASALDLHLVDTSSEALAGYLDRRRVLIVLDNCEHLLDACGGLAEVLLRRCRDLHLLATSREALGVDGEEVFRVPSLRVDTDAVQLFVHRARAVGGRLDLDPVGEDVVCEICRRLDGIPLAIELAAARTTHLAQTQILERLSDRFRLLTGGRRRVQRQQTLSAAIDWSHDLLTEAEKRLFRQLAVFRGSFSLQAVEEICDRDALDLLGSLVEKSLVNLDPAQTAARYRLLETVRLYAEDRLLASGEAESLRSTHRDWFLSWLESIPIGQLAGIGYGDRIDRVDPEADNLTAALEWSLEQERLDLVARMASRMCGYWWAHVRVGEMDAWWRVLRPRLAELSAEPQALALLVGAQYAQASGDFNAMENRSFKVLRVAAPGSWTTAYAWLIQALYWTYAEPDRGRRCIEEARKAAAAAGVAQFERAAVTQAANLLTGERAEDDRLGAHELLERLYEYEAPPETAPSTEFVVVGIFAALGETARASRLIATRTATTPIRRSGRKLVEAVIAVRNGELEAASEHLQELVAINREYAIPLGEVSCLIGFAALAAAAGDNEDASRHLASVRASVRPAAPSPFRTPVEVLLYRQTVRKVRAALDPHIAARCRAEGAEIPVSQAVDVALARLETANPEGEHHRHAAPADDLDEGPELS